MFLGIEPQPSKLLYRLKMEGSYESIDLSNHNFIFWMKWSKLDILLFHKEGGGW